MALHLQQDQLLIQPSSLPLIPNKPRQNRQNRGKMNGHMHSQGGSNVSYMPHLQQTPQSLASSKDASNQQAKFVPNGCVCEMSNGSASSAPSNSAGPDRSEMLSNMLAATSLDNQKQMLGERLYPFVSQHKPDLAAKITGMLLEMDNSELLLLLESPELLSAKVEEAVQVLKLSKTKLSNQDVPHPNYFSTEVAGTETL